MLDYSNCIQGAFALCRVVKRNEQTQKTSKRVGSSSSMGDFTSRRVSNEPLSISSDMSSQSSCLYNESRYSSPMTSPYPYEVSTIPESEPAPMETNTANLWVSPDLILDSSKVKNIQEFKARNFQGLSFYDFLLSSHCFVAGLSTTP